MILSDSLVWVPHDAELRCEKSAERGSSSGAWLPFSVVLVVVKGVVCRSLSPCRSFTSLLTSDGFLDVRSAAAIGLLVEAVVLVIVVEVVIVVVVVVVVVVDVVKGEVVEVEDVLMFEVVCVLSNPVVDKVDLDIFGCSEASVDMMLSVVEVFSVSILLS